MATLAAAGKHKYKERVDRNTRLLPKRHWWRLTQMFQEAKGRGFSSVQSLDRLGLQGDMRDDSAEMLFQSFLQEALVSSYGMGRDVHSLMSVQHFLC